MNPQNIYDLSLFSSHPLAAIAAVKKAKELQKKNPHLIADKSKSTPDATHILEDSFDQMTAYSSLIREGTLSPKEQQRVFAEMNVLHKTTLESYMTNFNAYSLVDPKKTTEVLNRFNMIYFEGIYSTILEPIAKLDKPTKNKESKKESKDFLDEAKEHIQNIAPTLKEYNYVKSIKRFGTRNVAAAVYETENGINYGFDTVYVVWKDSQGKIHHKELANSRDTKDYIHLNDIIEQNGKFSIKVGSGGSYSGKNWDQEYIVSEKELGISQTKTTRESLLTQLEKMFPNKNTQALEAIVTSLDQNISTVNKTTDKTYTGFVTDFEVDGKIIYAKGTSDVQQLKKEASYHEDAWTHTLMRPITPKLIGLVVEDKLGVLLTYGTQNTGIITTEDLHKYLTVRNRILNEFATKHKCNPQQIKEDSFATDIFNRAVSHTFMKKHMNKEIYSEDKRPILVPFPLLLERASKTKNNNLFEQLKTQAEDYHSAVVEYLEASSKRENLSLLHFDSRPENIFPENQCANTLVRPIGDFGFTRPGPVAVDLSRLESGKDSIYVPLYAFVCNSLEQEIGNNFELTNEDITNLQQRVNHLSYINLVRTLSSKLSRNCNDEAQRYLQLANNYLRAE
ncbi:hypothetical protein HOK51_01225 [Candidatus Woesearchaeota archaeon]|jgi:hypothetical protein|nr:hypothetical protein [Candidatus Woesearchaeota archaeon]MBT6518435.1 hypothetical protein [Candidatus Woesearchaeota archaeon]MBT7366602.1 hypothetical protein [Candidatus Woesearchaeota archaeon]